MPRQLDAADQRPRSKGSSPQNGAGEGQPERFDEQFADDLPAAGTERESDRDFAAALPGLREQQAGYVGTGD
jgi:hypothetical protein